MSLVELLCAAVIALNVGGGRTPETSLACKQMPLVVHAAQENNIDPTVMLALIHHESSWVPTARSHANACGLTQILPRYTGSAQTGVPRLTCRDLQVPETSIVMGARTLRYWHRRYGRGNMAIGLCGYNAGFRCKGPDPHAGGMNYSRVVRATARRISRRVERIRRSRR